MVKIKHNDELLDNIIIKHNKLVIPNIKDYIRSIAQNYAELLLPKLLRKTSKKTPKSSLNQKNQCETAKTMLGEISNPKKRYSLWISPDDELYFVSDDLKFQYNSEGGCLFIKLSENLDELTTIGKQQAKQNNCKFQEYKG